LYGLLLFLINLTQVANHKMNGSQLK